LFQIELQQLGLVTLDRDSIHAVLAEQRQAATGLTAKDYLKLGGLLNASHLIAGSVTPFAGGKIRMDARVFSVEAIETVATVSDEGVFPADLPLMLRRLARETARKIQSAGIANGETGPVAAAPKPEALIMFYRGLNACARGQPDVAVPWFMNAAALDTNFTAPLLWEIKAYELAGLEQFAAIRRAELADIFNLPGVAGATGTNQSGEKPVLAVLAPVVTGPIGIPAASLQSQLQQALLAAGRFRLFAFENIGDAMAEQDLKLSSFFTSQHAARYGRWLASDGLVLCRVSPAETGLVSLELSLVNPVNAAVQARARQTGPAAALPSLILTTVENLTAAWTNRAVAAALAAPEPSAAQSLDGNTGLRPVYQGLADALAQVKREPAKSDSHRALADAFASTGRARLSAYEIERSLENLDIHAPKAGSAFLAYHRWLFWEPSPASGAVKFVDRRSIDNLIQQLLDNYPQSLAAGCMRYNLAVEAWRAGKWQDAATQARQARQILEPLIAQYDRNAQVGVNRGELECEVDAATYFLEGSSLVKLDKPEEAASVFHHGLDFMAEFKVRNNCLPYGPSLGDFFGPERVYGYGGDPPGIQTRLEQQLVLLEGKPARKPGLDLERDAADIVSAPNAPARTRDDWLRCARQTADILSRAPAGDAAARKSILASAGACLNSARIKGAWDADVRPLIPAFVSLILEGQKIPSLDNAAFAPVASLTEAAVEIMSFYESAGMKEEGWTVLEPLLSDPYPVELELNLLQQLTWDAARYSREFKRASARLPAGGTNAPGAVFVKLGQIHIQNQRYREALDCYRNAVAKGASSADCTNLAGALLEIALESNPSNPALEIEKLRRELGFPPVQASWVEWFATARQYQSSRQLDLQKAVACYRGALDFLEHPEQGGIYHLEMITNPDRIVLRWGPGLGGVDLLWAENYDRRWYSAAFYLAQCLVKLDQKEEAAEWLRKIAIKVGGDSKIPLLDKDDWHGSSWSSSGLGVRAADLLQQLHQDSGAPKS